MKKSTKLLLGIVTALGVGTALKKYQDDRDKKIVSLALENAKSNVSNDTVTGTWIDMSAVWSNDLNTHVLVGGVMTAKSTYDFVADAKTGQIMSFEKQER